MIGSLMRAGLVEETEALPDSSAETAADLILTSLILTDTGFIAIGRERPTAMIAEEAAAIADALDTTIATQPRPASRGNHLTRAAQSALDAYKSADDAALSRAMDDLTNALTTRARAAAGAPRGPCQGTKQQAVLDLLRREDGATVAQIIDATGWQSHTVRGFLAGLKKKGITIDVLERFRQVGPRKEGARGSYSVYRIAP